MKLWRIPIAAFLVTSIALVGFGCKKKERPIPNTPGQTVRKTTTNVTQPAVTSPSSPDGYIAPEIAYLRQVLRNFAGAQSFRARMTVPMDQGTTVSEVEYAKDVGLHGTLTATGIPATEIYLLPAQVLFRSGTSTWLNLIYTDEGQRIAQTFASAFSLTPNATSTFISDTARIVSIEEDAANGCKRHTFTQDSPDGSRQTMFLCVKDDLPKISGTVTANGNLEIVYRDYNRPIAIVPPPPPPKE